MIACRRFVVALLLCTLLNLPLWSGRVGAKGEEPGMFTSLYMLEPQYGRILEPLNSVTLADDNFMSAIQLGDISPYETSYGAPPDMVESPGGITLAMTTNSCTGCTTVHAKYLTIRVVSLDRSFQIHSFHPRVALIPTYASDDGKRVAGFGAGKNSMTWYVLGTGAGKVLTKTSPSQACCGATLYDGASKRLYVAQSTSAHTLSVGVYATDNGKEVTGLTLDGVAAGTWQGSGGLQQMAQPGMALSPDGKHLAILDGLTNRLTIVDAPTMRVVSTQSVSQPQGILQRFGSFLGILPDSAFAKGEFMGTSLFMRYSRDGRSLYVTGSTGSMSANGQYTFSDIGVERIDVSSAQMTGHTLDGTAVTWWGEGADGSAVYTLVGADPYTFTCPCTLRAHDPVTLQTTAQRTFDAYNLMHLFIVG